MFYICIRLLPRLALFGHFKAQSFSPMVILLYSPSKPHVMAPKHACCCIAAAISRISTEERLDLSEYSCMFFFFYLSLWLIASGQAYTPAKVKPGLTTLFEDSTRMDMPTRRYTYSQSNIVWSFQMAAESGSWAVVLSNFEQNVRCYGESAVLSYYCDLGSHLNS